MPCGVRSSKGNNVTPSLSTLGLVQDALKYSLYIIVGFPSGSAVKNPPAMQEMQVPSLVQEDPLQMTTHSSILWEIPWTEEPGRATVHGVTKEWDTT